VSGSHAGQFARTGFRGSLDRQRNLDRTWELMGAWRGTLHRPAGALRRRWPRTRHPAAAAPSWMPWWNPCPGRASTGCSPARDTGPSRSARRGQRRADHLPRRAPPRGAALRSL